MDFGLTPQGFKRKRYADVISAMENRARNLFGENINLTERSPLGLFIRVIAWSVTLLWQVAEVVYNAAFVDTATGNDLDKVALYIGIIRMKAKKAIGEVTFTGDNTTIIPAGYLVSTTDDIVFETTDEVVITAGLATATIRAVEPGTQGNVPFNTITEIINPIIGINTVSNAQATTGGRNQETDAEFRTRYALSVAKGGASTIDSIRASLLEVDGVKSARVIENNSNTTDADGRPPKSFESYVLGGVASDVAKTILKAKAAGIQAYGTVQETVQDDAGQNHIIGFTYATEIGIYVNVTIVKSAAYPVDGDKLIRTEIIKYIGGQDEDGSIYVGLSMGQDVVYVQVIKACLKITGVEDAAVTIGIVSPPASTSNISINLTEIAETAWQKVVVS